MSIFFLNLTTARRTFCSRSSSSSSSLLLLLRLCFRSQRRAGEGLKRVPLGSRKNDLISVKTYFFPKKKLKDFPLRQKKWLFVVNRHNFLIFIYFFDRSNSFSTPQKLFKNQIPRAAERGSRVLPPLPLPLPLLSWPMRS